MCACAVIVQKPTSFDELKSDADTVIVDVRTPSEFGCAMKQHVPGAVNMPLGSLWETLPTTDKSKKYLLYCVGTSKA